MRRPSNLMISGCSPLMFSFVTASSPAWIVTRSISSAARFTNSSIEAGWIRPSFTSASSADRATSRRTGSNDEIRTICGDSSISSVTPVADSNDLMLRPSRPMMRPFMSSLGSCTIVAVRSLFGLLAIRCIAATRMRWASVCSSRSDFSSVARRSTRNSSPHSNMTSSRNCFRISSASSCDTPSSRLRTLFERPRIASRACFTAALSRLSRSCRCSNW